MRILFVTQAVDKNHPILGFVCDWLVSLSKQFSVKELRVVAFDSSKTSIDNTSISRIYFLSKWKRLIAFKKTIIKNPCSVVFVHMTPIWVLVGFFIWKLQGSRIVLWYTHGSDSFLLRIAVSLADVTLTATPEAFPFRHSRVHAVGHAVGDRFFSVSRKPRPEDRFFVLSVGRISRIKGVIQTIRFFAEIYKQEPRARLMCIGQQIDPEYLREVKNVIHELSLGEVVQLEEPKSYTQMPEVYANSDLLLHMSETGSLDKVVIEALASGCPVLSTNLATKEAFGSDWYWDRSLDTIASDHALSLLKNGVLDSTRRKISTLYNLNHFWKKVLPFLSASDKKYNDKHENNL